MQLSRTSPKLHNDRIAAMRYAAAAAALFLLARSPGLLSYLAAHPAALGPQTVQALFGHVLDVLLVCGALAGVAAVGRRALRYASLLREEPAWKQWLYGLVAGTTALSYLLWAALAAGALSFGPAALLWAVLALAALAERDALAALLPPPPKGAVELAAFAVLLAALACGAATAGAPPTGWDALANHLAAPKLYLAERSFHRLPWMLGAHYPLSAETQYAWLMSLRGPHAPQWLGWAAAAVLAAATGAWAGRGAGWTAAALVACAPPLTRVAGTGKNDPLLAVAAFAALLAALDAGKSRRGWTLAGLLAGAAAAVKLNGLWAAAALGVVACASGAGPAAAFAAAAFVSGAPWYARDWWWTGNPFWPMLGPLLGDAEGAAVYARLRAATTVGAGPFEFLPKLLLEPGIFLDAPRALLAAALGGAWRALPRRAWAFCALFAALWLAVYQEGRLLLPVVPVLAAAVALRAKSAPKAGLALLLLAAAPALTLSPNNELFGFLAVSPERELGDARRRYLMRALGAPYAMAQAANALPAGARVALYRDSRGFWLEVPWASFEPIANSHAGVPDADALRRRLREAGFTHLLHNPTLGPIAGDRAEYERVDALYAELARQSKKIAEADPLALYELK